MFIPSGLGEKVKLMGVILITNELKFADVILIILVVLAIGLTFQKNLSHKAEQKVFVYKNAQIMGTYSLDQNKTIVIDEHNTIQIDNGQVRMVKADCPDKRCIKQGWTRSLPIICLPNHLIVEIKGSEAEKKFILQ